MSIRRGFENLSNGLLVNGSIFGVRYFRIFGMKYSLTKDIDGFGLHLRSTSITQFCYEGGWNESECNRFYYKFQKPVPTCGCFDKYLKKDTIECASRGLNKIHLDCNASLGCKCHGRSCRYIYYRCGDNCGCNYGLPLGVPHRICSYVMPLRQIPTPHSSPDYDCTCGFYALYESNSSMDLSLDIEYNRDYVLGVVEGKGKTVLGDRGFRTQYLRIRGVTPYNINDMSSHVLLRNHPEPWLRQLYYPSKDQLVATFQQELDMSKYLLETLK